LRVRRWSDNTLVNGQPFDDARLTAGDVLTLGSLDLEVVVPQLNEPADVLTELVDELWEPDAPIEPDQNAERLETELGAVREQLSARDRELAQARFSIDVLERQLIDSQHTMHAFAEERLTWGEQFDELESRLADYVERIQELERQLDEVRAVRADDELRQPTISNDWAAEAPPSEAAGDDFINANVVASVEVPASGARTDAGANWEEIVRETLPEEVGQDAVETVVEPAEAAPVEQVAEIDATLDHPQGISIWQEEPEVAAEGNVVGPSYALADEATTSDFTQPASFIERYAHLLSADEAAPPAPVASPQPSVAVAPTPDAHADEESVEQYMAKLLERMRGGAARESEPSAADVEPAAPSDRATEGHVEAAMDSPEIQPITDLEELRQKVSAPELASDRMAMRALANQSARHAIGVHTARALRRSAATRLIVALLGASAGFYLLLDAPGWKNLQFAAGCVAAFAAIYWGKLTLATLIQGIRVGAFHDFEEDVDTEKALHPPLPIDVEPPASNSSAADGATRA
jgi:hypothetical protein